MVYRTFLISFVAFFASKASGSITSFIQGFAIVPF
jgi:hypothetical protein